MTNVNQPSHSVVNQLWEGPWRKVQKVLPQELIVGFQVCLTHLTVKVPWVSQCKEWAGCQTVHLSLLGQQIKGLPTSCWGKQSLADIDILMGHDFPCFDLGVEVEGLACSFSSSVSRSGSTASKIFWAVSSHPTHAHE